MACHEVMCATQKHVSLPLGFHFGSCPESSMCSPLDLNFIRRTEQSQYVLCLSVNFGQ